MSKKKRRYIEKPNPFTASLFGQHFHRWPNASYSLVYAMACVEVVANSSEEVGVAYQEIVAAWGAPGLKKLFDGLIGVAPAADVEELKDTLRHPEKGFLPDPDKPFREIEALYSGELANKHLTEDEQRSLLEKVETDPQFADVRILLELTFGFIIGGFNRETDLEEDIYRVNPFLNPAWVVFAVTYRTALEHAGITLEKLCKLYKVGRIKGKLVDFVEVMDKQPMSRTHRRVVGAAKKLDMKLRHDHLFLEAAWLWYQCRVVHKGVEDYWAKQPEDEELDLKNLQKVVGLCDKAVGYQRGLRNNTV